MKVERRYVPISQDCVVGEVYSILRCFWVILLRKPAPAKLSISWPPSRRFSRIHYDTIARESHSVYGINSVESWRHAPDSFNHRITLSARANTLGGIVRPI